MDRPRRRPGLLTEALAPIGLASIGLASLALAGSAAQPPLRAMRWLAPGADAARILTRQPAECFRRPADPEQAYSAELGRAAFRTPLLLGGQAARAGVACETCHRNGRTNPDFDFPGLSGAPGTADVTSSLFSSHRGDGVDNPKPIPDLGGAKSALKIDQDSASPALETFIHGLVTQEFDGAEPPPAVLKGLADYVRSMDPAACPVAARVPVTSRATLDEARRAARAGLAALGRRDGAAAALMVEASRSQLGMAAERYDLPGLAGDVRALGKSSEALRAALDLIRAGRNAEARGRLTAWLTESEALGIQLRRDEPRSLYNPARLRAVAR